MNGQHRYAVNVVLAQVAPLTHDEAMAITDAITDGQSRYDPASCQLHLFWSVLADSMSEATDEARVILADARAATGTFDPRTIVFEVRETDGDEKRMCALQGA